VSTLTNTKTTIKIGIDIREALNPKKAGKGEYNFQMVENIISLSKNTKSRSIVLFNDDRFIAPKSWQKYIHNIPKKGLVWHKSVAKECLNQNIKSYFSPTSYITPHYIERYSPTTKTLTTVHDLIVYLYPKSHPLKPRIIEKYFLKKLIQDKTTIFTTVSESTKDDLFKVFPKLNEDRVHVVKNGLKKFPVKSTKSKKETKPFILSVSTILPRKNYITLLQAFNIVKDQVPHNLHIVGKYDSKNIKFLKTYVSKNQLEKRVKFLGYVSSQKLSTQYQKADLLVIPSLYEGFGLPVIEGLKRGLPVICSDIKVFHEVADPAALFFDPTNHIDLANQILFLSQNLEQKQILSIEGPKLVKKYNWLKSSKKIWKILKST
jgi:glycosyltransferase involved in cell wall biosynthesis